MLVTISQQSTRYGRPNGTREVSVQDAIRRLSRLHGPKTAAQRIIAAPRGKKGWLISAIKQAHRARIAAPRLSLEQRLHRHLIALCEQEIDRRALSTPAGWDEFPKSVKSRSNGLWLISGEGWFEYSRRHGRRFQSASYLCGRDEGQLFAVRVPSTMKSVAEAVEWLTPREVRIAQDKGLPVKRQGDIFFAPKQIRDHDMAALSGTRHEVKTRRDGGLTIVHPEHKPVILAKRYTWRAYQSSQIDGNSRRLGD